MHLSSIAGAVWSQDVGLGRILCRVSELGRVQLCLEEGIPKLCDAHAFEEYFRTSSWLLLSRAKWKSNLVLLGRLALNLERNERRNALNSLRIRAGPGWLSVLSVAILAQGCETLALSQNS